jgi:hypothetical protein
MLSVVQRSRRAVLLLLVGVLCLGACGGDADDAADTSVASTKAPRGQPIVIRSTMIGAAEEGSEPIATGTVLEGSTLGATPFCVGGTSWSPTRASTPRWGRT